MFIRYYRLRLLALMIAVLGLLLTTGPASAHGDITVDDYDLAIGFLNEPAYQGEPNGLDLVVINNQTQQPVIGLADTLKVEILFGSMRKALSIRPQWGREGAYTADVLPTAAGEYTWHIWGDIQGTPVDITMTSSPDTFSAVEPKSSLAFPAAEPTPLDLQDQAAAAADTAHTALAIGGLGLAMGLMSTVLGLVGRRRHRPPPAAHESQQVA